jgi:hypothetical protein
MFVEFDIVYDERELNQSINPVRCIHIMQIIGQRRQFLQELDEFINSILRIRTPIYIDQQNNQEMNHILYCAQNNILINYTQNTHILVLQHHYILTHILNIIQPKYETLLRTKLDYVYVSITFIHILIKIGCNKSTYDIVTFIQTNKHIVNKSMLDSMYKTIYDSNLESGERFRYSKQRFRVAYEVLRNMKNSL